MAQRMIFAGALTLFALSAAVGTAAQSPPAQSLPTPSTGSWHAKNLKVLPANIPRDQLIGTMRGFTSALGVKCTYCHVGEEGKRETMDFASDAKANKDIARSMLRMMHRLNEEDLPAITALKAPKVTCYTCHRGAEKPLVEPLPPAA